MLEFWHSLQIRSLTQAWHGFPPLQRALTVYAIAFIFGYFSLRDYSDGGKRFAVYGLAALLFVIYAVSLSGVLTQR